jgi:hypothetical protein
MSTKKLTTLPTPLSGANKIAKASNAATLVHQSLASNKSPGIAASNAPHFCSAFV